MIIPYPCPKPINEVKSSKKGLYCNDCNQILIDLIVEDAAMPPKGSCVISFEEEIENEKTVAINKTYRFALALFVVMGSSLILSNTIEAKNLLSNIEHIKHEFTQIDTNFIRIKTNYSDENGYSIKHVKVSAILANGKIITSKTNKKYNNILHIPVHQVGKTITLQYIYYNETQTQVITVTQDYQTVPTVTFARNKKDVYAPQKHFKTMGCPAF